MKYQGAGNETRFDSPEHQIERARNSAPGVGVRVSYKRWCGKCKMDKPAAGAKQLAPGIFKCADCIALKPATTKEPA